MEKTVPSGVAYIDAASLKVRLASKQPPLTLDVREGEEFDAGHIRGAVLAPWHDVARCAHGIKKTREIVVYCHSGPRSVKAAHVLEGLGYKNVKVLRSGYADWITQ
jgi:hydroxyacylglutathione hydrolase